MSIGHETWVESDNTTQNKDLYEIHYANCGNQMCIHVEQVRTVQDKVWTINEALSQSQEIWLPPHLYSPLVSCISDMDHPTS